MAEYTIKIKKHLAYYVSLVIMLILGVSLVFFTAYDKGLQVLSLIGVVACYIIWAAVHQHIHHHLTPKIVVEYLLVGLMGLTFSLFLFNF